MKKNNKGFTLMEMLIVVAIIAILVAISIPVFSAQLEKARESTDVANMRAAKACAVTRYLTDDDVASKGGSYYYDAVNGTLVATSAKPTGYGKGTGADGGIVYADYVNATAYVDQVISVVIDADGTVTLAWEA